MSEEHNLNDMEPPIESELNQEVPVGSKRKASDTASVKPPRARKKYSKRADCWKNFLQRTDDPTRCICKFCGVDLACDSKTVGTSPMIAHIARCKQFKDFDDKEKQKVLSGDSNGNLKVIVYDPLLFRRSVNEMIVVNELPLSFVESEGWKRFCFNVLPMYKTFCRKTCSKDIVEIYLREKAALKNLFGIAQQRVSLTTDIWTSPTTSCNYMVITAHWIQTNWEMHKRILSFKVITDHKGETIAGHLLECLDEWGIEKVFTVTVDNAKSNDRALDVFKDELRLRGADTLVRDGQFLHVRCCAHILNLIVGDGLKKSKPAIAAIRNAVKYVRSSYNRLKSFAMRCETGKVCRGSLPLDVITRWNSCYLMLTSALKLRVAFEKMVAEDKLFCEYFQETDEKTKLKRVGPPTYSDWEEVSRLAKFLKIFYKSTVVFSASNTVTSTVCYNEIVDIERNLIAKCGSRDEETRKQGHVMRDKFEKYWDGLQNMNPLVIMASVFDPRNKMKFASLCFDQLYGKGTVESRQLHAAVERAMKRLYDEYSSRLSKPVEIEGPSDFESPTLAAFSDDEDDCEGIESIYKKMADQRTGEDTCSELQIYLTEKTEAKVENKLGMPYDVLSWWKCNSTKYPILSEVARDVLATQVSSVASESAFSTSGRVLDPYRSCLTPFMVEVLLCTQQWLRCSYKTQAQVANLAQMLADVEFLESLDSRNSTVPPP